MDSDIKKHENMFYIGTDQNDPLAEITFIFSDDKTIIINHTYVSEELNGKGIGTILLEKVVEFARKENLKIIPVCSFAIKKLTKSDKYKDVLNE